MQLLYLVHSTNRLNFLCSVTVFLKFIQYKYNDEHVMANKKKIFLSNGVKSYLKL